MGSTTIAPGESSTVTVSMNMGKGMGGPHLFEVTVNSNDPAPAANKITLRANYIDS